MLKANISLEGFYKCEVFKPDGELRSVYTGKNFITSTGLSMASKFAFVDCFRYLSIGVGTSQNTILGNNGWGTTGLQTVLGQFNYIGGRTQVSDPTHLYTNYNNASFLEQANSVTLTRGWRVPAAASGNTFFTQNYNFQEFMLSPGCPPATGMTRTPLCTYEQTDYDDLGNLIVGPENTATALYYEGNSSANSICSGGLYAFARIVTPISVFTNDYMVFNYSLQVSVDSGNNYFNLNPPTAFANQRSAPLKSNNWAGGLTGAQTLIHHGMKLITPNGGPVTNSPWGGPMIQINNYDPNSDFGESFISSWGAPLEPNLGLYGQTFNYLNAYLSTDNLQFLVNQVEGGAQTSILDSKSGLMGWRSTPYTDSLTQFDPRLFNIRRPTSDFGSQNAYPFPTDYTTETFNPDSDIAFDGYAADKTFDVSTVLQPYIPSSRIRQVTRNIQFDGPSIGASPNSNFINLPIRSLVLSYIDTNFPNYNIPYFDMIFTNTGNNGPLPPINTVAHTFATGNNDKYFYLENNAKLTVSFVETWTSPCGPPTVGC